MERYGWLIELCSEVDQRDGAKAKTAMTEERRVDLSDANGMLEGSELLESDARLPENAGEATELKMRASDLRLQAEEIFALARTSAEDRTREANMLEALHAARR